MPDLNTEVEKLKKDKEKLQNEITEMGKVQVALSRSIVDMKPELEKLKAERDDRIAELKVIAHNIEQRKAERDENQNEREGELVVREVELDDREKKLQGLEEKLEVKSKELEEREQRLNTQEESLDADHSQLLTDKLNVKNREDVVVLAEEQINKRAADQANLSTVLREKEIAIEDKNKNAEKMIALAEEWTKAVDEEKEKLKEAQDALLKAQQELAVKEKDLKEIAEGVDIRLRKAEEADKIFQAQIKTVTEENKKIELAWLKLNKAIRDKNLDLEIAELKGS